MGKNPEPAAVPTDWQVIGAGNFNGDGRDDILRRNADGTLSKVSVGQL